jgi:hypothetical protein
LLTPWLLGITSAEARELVEAMRNEAKGNEQYMRIDLIAAVGRKPANP